MKKKLTFVIPCYNEEKNIKLFYDDVLNNFKNKKYQIELIFINDGSKDNTITELKKVTKLHDFDVKVINFSRNFGKDAALYAGMSNSTGDYTVLIDADMQQPPSLVLKMLDVIENNDDVDIVAFYQQNRIENKLVSKLKSCFYKSITKISGIDFVNGASDFRLFRRNVLEAILKLTEHNRFSKGIFAWIGFNTYYIPYVPNERVNGKSSFNIKKLFKYALSGIMSFSKAPFKFIGKIGILFILLSVASLIALLCLNMFNLIYYLIIFITFIFGLNLIILTYISEYIFRCYNELLNRPIYISKEIITNYKE